VSTPLHWEELEERLDPRDYGMSEALARIERKADLLRPVLEEPQALAPARRALAHLR
jgi:DNA primase